MMATQSVLCNISNNICLLDLEEVKVIVPSTLVSTVSCLCVNHSRKGSGVRNPNVLSPHLSKHTHTHTHTDGHTHAHTHTHTHTVCINTVWRAMPGVDRWQGERPAPSGLMMLLYFGRRVGDGARGTSGAKRWPGSRERGQIYHLRLHVLTTDISLTPPRLLCSLSRSLSILLAFHKMGEMYTRPHTHTHKCVQKHVCGLESGLKSGL